MAKHKSLSFIDDSTWNESVLVNPERKLKNQKHAYKNDRKNWWL
nr:MAG TPA: hypothetical protein [Caudoviricetes sp.]